MSKNIPMQGSRQFSYYELPSVFFGIVPLIFNRFHCETEHETQDNSYGTKTSNDTKR